ncbi:MAG: iron-containing alcohol dehydrogenase [Phycisphaerales bacterium]|nr:iron-containing alcohol dehydrogenase [Phycisphaerales bacterium]
MHPRTPSTMQHLFDRYCGFHRVAPDGTVHETFTRHITVAPDVSERVPEVLDALVGSGRIAVFFDTNTRRVAGDALLATLDSAGRAFTTFLLEPRDGEDIVVCDEARIDDVEAMLTTDTFVHAIAVGSGTINDLVKMASFRRDLAYSAVGTAPSMNGYTSSIAAILSDGIKTTQPCRAPLAVFADPEVMAEAPYRMIASGLGDLYSKPVSNADWRLSHRLLGSFHSDIVMEIVEAGSALLDGVAPRLPSRDRDAVARLTGAIMLSGLAMQAAGTSGPASGGEHLVSNYIDMTAHAWDQTHDFHGCQVAVGTVTTSRLYEEVRALDPATIDVDALVARHQPWPEYADVLRERFGDLSDAVLSHAEKGYPSRDELRGRLETLVANWDDVMNDVGTTLRTSDDLRAELVSAECPVTFPELDVDRDRALAAVRWSKDIRARYTILHLAAELGVLDDFAVRWVDAQF